MSEIFKVRKSELVNYPCGRETFRCFLEDEMGRELYFFMFVSGCVGEKEFRAQYELISPYCIPNARLIMHIVYSKHSSCFKMMAYGFTPIDPKTGFSGEVVYLPGLITLDGKTHIPLITNEELPRVEYKSRYDIGLQWDRRLSFFHLILRWILRMPLPTP